jgi:2-polyprenyl-6-methoxyphenol hydroxylase-like FAD-dependent oxidoreductase
MTNTRTPLIVGAGPVGLAAALFLRKRGMETRIIDSKTEPSVYSKALAVNPRTLELLEPTGVTEQLLKIGKPIRRMTFHGNHIAHVELSKHLHHRYPFMLAISQATTERLLKEALEKLGGNVERGTAFLSGAQSGTAMDAMLQTAQGTHTASVPWILGADGARSKVRESAGIAFNGTDLANAWYLADVTLDTALEEDAAHIFALQSGEFVFMLRVVTGAPSDTEPAPLWRVISNHPQPLTLVKNAKAVSEPVWQSQFHIGHRIAGTLQKENIFLAGDAAHIHSPMGARGMNLGIEDAYVFAALVQQGRQADYANARKPVDEAVVRRVERLTRLVNGQTGMLQFIRYYMLPFMISMPWLYRRILPTVVGLDHPIKMDL